MDGCATGGEELVSDTVSGATESFGNMSEVPVQGCGYEQAMVADSTAIGMQDPMMMLPRDQQLQMTHNMHAANLQNLQWGNDMMNSVS